VFASGVFDLVKFEVAEASDALVFTFAFRGPLENPWKSPVGLSLPTIDVYIDEDGAKGTGGRMLLEGRNAALSGGRGWERAVWIEGWNRKVFSAGSDGLPVELSGEPRIAVDAAGRTVTVAVPRSILGAGEASRWSYAAVVLSQDGFPSAGVRRVRDVIAGDAERWKAGGAKADSNHTRIFDLALPSFAVPTQEEALSSYPATPADPAAAASFPSVPLVSLPLSR
jgi:carbohydrate-binding DOMON domain-containing protein